MHHSTFQLCHSDMSVSHLNPVGRWTALGKQHYRIYNLITRKVKGPQNYLTFWKIDHEFCSRWAPRICNTVAKFTKLQLKYGSDDTKVGLLNLMQHYENTLSAPIKESLILRCPMSET